MLNMFRALLRPSSVARDYVCVIIAYGVQCLVAGCRGSGAEQQAMRPERGMLHDCKSCNIPLPGRIACCSAPDPRQPANIPLTGRIACCPVPDPRQPATKHCTP